MKLWLTDPNNLGLWLLLLLLLLFSMIALTAKAEEDEDSTVEQVDASIKWLFRIAKAKPMAKNHEKRRAVATEIVAAAQEFGPDPFLMTGMFYHESSFADDIINGKRLGKSGEYGIGQVGKEVKKKCEKHGLNMKLRSDQIRCTAWTLQGKIDKCGTIKNGLNAYCDRGNCRIKTARKAWQVETRLRLAVTLRKIGIRLTKNLP